MIRFNAQKLAAVSLAQSTESTRYYLCGVYFDGSRAVATDGHIMTLANDEAVNNETPGIYPISKKTLAAMKGRFADHVEISDGMIKVLNDDLNNPTILHIEPCQEIDGTFPDYARVIPSYEETETPASFAAFGEIILGKLVATAKILGKKSSVRIMGKDINSPHIVRYKNESIFSVAMPIRCEEAAIGTPSWYSN